MTEREDWEWCFCTVKTLYLSAYCCLPVFVFAKSKFWREQNLSYFSGNWKTRREKLGAETVLAIWLADPAVLTVPGSVSRSKDGLMAALNIFQHNTSSISILPIIPTEWLLSQNGRKRSALQVLGIEKKKECCLGVLWFVAPAMSPCNKVEHLTWWALRIHNPKH